MKTFTRLKAKRVVDKLNGEGENLAPEQTICLKEKAENNSFSKW